MHCTEGAAARWWGGLAGLENNNTAAWREEEIGYKKKKENAETRSRAAPPANCVLPKIPRARERDRHKHRARRSRDTHRQYSVVYAPSEAIAMQHGGRCRRYRLSRCCCCCCGRRYCYCRLSPNGADTVVERHSRVVVHSGKSTMTGHRQRRRPGFTRATITTTTDPSPPHQII